MNALRDISGLDNGNLPVIRCQERSNGICEALATTYIETALSAYAGFAPGLYCDHCATFYNATTKAPIDWDNVDHLAAIIRNLRDRAQQDIMDEKCTP